MKKWIALLTVLTMTLAMGCAKMVTDGKKLDTSRTTQLAVGTTAPDSVVKLFGQPSQVQDLPGGEQRYVYNYYYRNPHWWTTDEVERQNLELVFKGGRLDRYNLQEQLTDYVDREPGIVR